MSSIIEGLVVGGISLVVIVVAYNGFRKYQALAYASRCLINAIERGCAPEFLAFCCVQVKDALKEGGTEPQDTTVDDTQSFFDVFPQKPFDKYCLFKQDGQWFYWTYAEIPGPCSEWSKPFSTRDEAKTAALIELSPTKTMCGGL